jgi:hypothetical protein
MLSMLLLLAALSNPTATATPVIHCPTVPGFAPNMIIKVGTYEAQTVLDHHGCPAVLVLIPLKQGASFKEDAKATPQSTATPGGSHRDSRRN